MDKADKKTDFAAGLKELEAITAWFESEEVDLDQALSKFERGVELAAKLRAQLKVVDNQVEQIKQKFDQAARPLPAEETSPAPADEPDLFSKS